MNTKKVLVVYYTQSGQMRSIAEHFCASFAADPACSVTYEELKPVTSFPFPWTAFTFFNGFPEVFKQKPIALQPYSDRLKEKYDLVVLAYQPWFLTPAPVTATFLQSPEGKAVLNGTKVVTIIGCRNMWLGAQEKVKRHLKAASASLIANIALVDKSPNVVSLVTILRWMLWGKKEKFWVFPAAGVSAEDIQKATVYGQEVKASLENGTVSGLQQQLNDQGAVDIVPELVMMEARGQRAFGIWSGFIGGAPLGSVSRSLRVYIFMVLLPTAVLVLSPLLMLISALTLRLKKDDLMKKVNYFKMNELS